MEKVDFHGTEVDRCRDCQGLFFDEFEKDALKKFKDAATLDVGSAKVGKVFNKVDLINCPRCSGRMIRMVGLQQNHIWFEHCTVCGGSFFDAGEFRDLAKETIVDFFRDLLTPERR